MRAVQRGDAAAYHALFQRHHERVYGFLLRSTREPEAAADLLQETFLRVYRRRDAWSDGRPVRPWLFGIAANAARDRVRQLARRPESALPADDLLPAVPASPHARLDLEAAIAALPGPYRDAFLLGFVEGFDHTEVAALLGISPDNARARISRARAALRDALGEPG